MYPSVRVLRGRYCYISLQRASCGHFADQQLEPAVEPARPDDPAAGTSRDESAAAAQAGAAPAQVRRLIIFFIY